MSYVNNGLLNKSIDDFKSNKQYGINIGNFIISGTQIVFNISPGVVDIGNYHFTNDGQKLILNMQRLGILWLEKIL